jgi:hypothetical protein
LIVVLQNFGGRSQRVCQLDQLITGFFPRCEIARDAPTLGVKIVPDGVSALIASSSRSSVRCALSFGILCLTVNRFAAWWSQPKSQIIGQRGHTTEGTSAR